MKMSMIRGMCGFMLKEGKKNSVLMRITGIRTCQLGD